MDKVWEFHFSFWVYSARKYIWRKRSDRYSIVHHARLYSLIRKSDSNHRAVRWLRQCKLPTGLCFDLQILLGIRGHIHYERSHNRWHIVLPIRFRNLARSTHLVYRKPTRETVESVALVFSWCVPIFRREHTEFVAADAATTNLIRFQILRT